jgi:hypothetical protein
MLVLDSTGSGQGPVAGCCECGDEPSGSCAMELVRYIVSAFEDGFCFIYLENKNHVMLSLPLRGPHCGYGKWHSRGT